MTQINQLKTEMEALNSKKISDLKTEMNTQYVNQINELKTEIEVLKISQGPVVMLCRQEVGNPVDYFDKTFAEYQQGFEANGESWIGLNTLYDLTSQKSYKLKTLIRRS